MARHFALVSNGPLSGKSTLAKHLEREYGFIRADHSFTVVESYVEFMRREYSDLISVEHVYANKEAFRQALQRHSLSAGFSSPESANTWHIRTLERSGCNVTQARCPGAKPVVCPDKNVVIDPFRGEVQAQGLRGLGFTLVQINIKDVTRCERARVLGKMCSEVLAAMEAAPDLEMGIDNPDITLVGELPVDVLGRTLMHRPEGMQGFQIFGSK